MKTILIKIVGVVLLLGSVTLVWRPVASFSQEVSKPLPERQQKALIALVSSQPEERLKAALQLDGDRQEMIKNLLAILRGTNSIETKIPAAVILGEYQAEQAVPFLVSHLEWEASLPPRGGIEYTTVIPRFNDVEDNINTKPVSGPLANIGMPAIPAVLNKIRQTDNPRIRQKCLYICHDIEGMEATQFRLQKLFDKESDPIIKERIQAALKFEERIAKLMEEANKKAIEMLKKRGYDPAEEVKKRGLNPVEIR